MVCHPEIQKEAQAELDQVLDGRLPEHSDLVSLPYLSALIKEVYRYAGVYFKNSFLLLQVHAKLFLLLLDGSLYFHWVSLLFLLNNLVNKLIFLKAFRISRLATISTTAITSLPTLSWWPTNGDSRLLPPSCIEFLTLHSIGQCHTMNGITQTRTSSGLSAFWRMDNSTIQLETRWI